MFARLGRPRSYIRNFAMGIICAGVLMTYAIMSCARNASLKFTLAVRCGAGQVFVRVCCLSAGCDGTAGIVVAWRTW